MKATDSLSPDALPPEVPRLTLGFVPLLDAALLVTAREGGFFAAQGLRVDLSRENAWSTLRDKVAAGLLDGAQMLAPLPLAMRLGLGRPPCDTLAPITLSRNGNAIVLATSLAERCGATLGDDPALSARALGDRRRRQIQAQPQAPRLKLAMVYPFSCQHYQLRDWLALGGLDPEHDVELVVLPPARMADALRSGQIDGFCAGEPWGSLAASQSVGRLVATGAQLWPEAPEKVLGVTRAWAERHPATLAALLRALVAASDWLGEAQEHRRQALDWLALPPYLDRSVDHLEAAALGAAPLGQRLHGRDMLRPVPASAERFAEHLHGAGRSLSRHDLDACHAAVHFDAALHQ